MRLTTFLTFLLACLQLVAAKETEEYIPLSDVIQALTSDHDHLVGGIISPLTGNPCLREVRLKRSTDCEGNIQGL